MKRKYLIILVLISALLWWCNHWQSNNQAKTNTNQLKDVKWQKLVKTSLSWDNLSWINDPLHLLHLEKSGEHLLYVWTYLLKDTMILNEKMLKSIQQFQKLGSWLTEIEKNALEKTLQNYQKNLELQKEFMKSWAARQKCMQKIYPTKPQIQQKPSIIQPKEIVKPKKEISPSKQKLDNLKKQPKQEETKQKQEPVKTTQKPVEQENTKSNQSNSQTEKETNNNQQKQSENTKPVKQSNWF